MRKEDKLILTINGVLAFIITISAAIIDNVVAIVLGVPLGLYFFSVAWLSRKVIKGNPIAVKMVAIDEEGMQRGEGAILGERERDIIISIFDKRAGWLLDDSFEFSTYAWKICTSKGDVLLYPDHNNASNIKVTKHIFGLKLNAQEQGKLKNIVKQYNDSIPTF